ncbi:hypothetical protein ACFL6Y_05820 [Elusimicrobiota bacterium]
MDYVLNYNKILRPLLDNRTPLAFLQSKTALCEFFAKTKINRPNPSFAFITSELTARYALQHPGDITAYFRGKLKLFKLCRKFAGFIHGVHGDKKLNRDMVVGTIGGAMAFHTDSTVKSILRDHSFSREINMFGFGLGDAYYEKEIQDYLIKRKIAKKVALYGYDPFAKGIKNVKLLSADNLLKPPSASFDLILARWSLHHVPAKKRWKLFEAALSHLKPKSIAIIIEHGFVDTRARHVDVALYRLLNGILDTVGNIGIWPNWFASTKPDYGRNFFVDFLCDKDIRAIQENCKVRLSRKIINIGPVFPWQSIIILKPKPVLQESLGKGQSAKWKRMVY